MKCHLACVRRAVIKETEINVGNDVVRLAPSCTVGECKICSCPEDSLQFLKTLKRELMYYPTIPLKSFKSSNLNRYLFTAAFFTITLRWEHSKCPSVDEQKTECGMSRHWNSIQLNWILEMTKIVNFMLYVFCYNKKEEKERQVISKDTKSLGVARTDFSFPLFIFFGGGDN